MDCIVQRDSTFEEFLVSWAQYSTAIIDFAESHKSNKELKRCFRDDEDDPDADSEHTVTNASEVTICVSVTGSLTALRCLGYFLGAKQKKKAFTSSSSISNSSNPFIDVPALLIEPPVSTCTCSRAYSAWGHFLVISSK